MNKSVRVLILSTLAVVPASLLVVSPAIAQAKEQGFYLSTDMGLSNSSVKRFSRDLSATECDIQRATVERCDYTKSNRNFAVNAGVGYQVGEYFAFELNYYDLVNDKSQLETTATAIIGNEAVTLDADQTLDMRLKGFGVRAVATIPINERWSALVNFGMGRFKHERNEWAEFQWRDSSQPEPEIRVNQQESKAVPFAGIGAQYRLNSQFDIRAMLTGYALSGEQGASTPFNGRSLTTATLGLVYRF